MKERPLAAVCHSGEQANTPKHFLGIATSPSSEWDLDVLVNGISLWFHTDMGADEAMLTGTVFKEQFPEFMLHRIFWALCGLDGKPLNVMEMATLKLACNNSHSGQNTFTLQGLKGNLLDKPAAEELSLISQVSNIKSFPSKSRKH